MIVDAWQCERCGRLHPAEYTDVLPKGWLTIYVERAGAEAEEGRSFCSDPCAGLWFRNPPAKKKRQPEKMAEPLIDEHGQLKCPECGKGYMLPQHLGMHRKRAHDVPSKRDLEKRSG